MLITGVRTLTSALSAPALSSSVAGSTATLNWTAPTPTGQSVIAGYRVYKSSTLGGTYTQVGGALPPTQLSLADTLSATSFYKVEAFDQFVTGVRSGGIQCAPVGTGQIVYKPGNRVWIGYSNMPSFATIKSICDGLFGPGGSDPNGFIKGIRLNPTWSQVEGPTLGDYSAGDAAISAVISLLKSYPIPRDLTLGINGGGNGYSSISSTAFQSSFCPAYMNAGVKGSATDQYGGGEVHLRSDGVTPLDRPYIVIWNFNVVARQGALFNHWWNTFGPDTSTGGIYRIDPYNEISVNQFTPGYSTASINAVFPTWMSTIRGTNKFLIYVKPTFINPNTGDSYGNTIVPAMFNNHISMGCEDCAPLHDWGMKAYLGLWASTPTNYAGTGVWDYHYNVDPAELWQTRNANSNAAIPPATYGPGLFYDVPGHPGIMTTVNQLSASHGDWYIDGFGGPNVVRRVPGQPVTVGGVTYPVPANPTPGPGAGLTSSRPNIIDVLANNMAYPGMINGGLSVPSTTYPSSYP